MSTIRVTVGDSGAGFDLPEIDLPARQLLDRIARQNHGGLSEEPFLLHRLETDGLIRWSVIGPETLPLGRAVLEHYEGGE